MAKRRLTRRQAWRIGKVQQERRERLQRKLSTAEALLEDTHLGPEREGLVIANHGANLKIEGLDQGRPDGVVRHVVPRANLALPVAGDRVVWRPARDGQGVVTALLERTSELGRPAPDGSIRPLAANIDRILVVAATRPPLHEDLIDRYLVAAELLDIRPLLVINKGDLLSPDQATALRDRLRVYTDIGVTVLFASTKRAGGLAAVEQRLSGHCSVLVGQSGVGKSSIIQHLLPDLAIRVDRLSGHHGRHTTSTTTLYHLPGGGDLIDSPGVRRFHLWPMPPATLARGFPEFRPYLGKCRFSDCRHLEEPGCALRQGVEQGHIDPRRLANFHHIAATSRGGE